MNLPFIKINPLGMMVVFALVIFVFYLYAGAWTTDKSLDMELISIKHLLAVSVNAAELGGIKVRDIRKNTDLKEQSKGKTKEGANDPVTVGDLLSHRTMLYSLKKSFPNIKIVSEEHENEIPPHDIGPPVSAWKSVDPFPNDVWVPQKDIVIWIDPLDATQEYTENLLHYVTTMVCVSIRGKPILGVIHKPFENKTIWAWNGRGASTLTLTPVSKHASTKEPTIIVSRSHAGKVKEVAKAAFGSNANVVSAGGAGYKAIEVAEGRADAYVHVTLIKKWDICAGNALLSALGGKMTTLSGSPIDYGNPTDVKNEKGLVGTVQDHEQFISKLSSLAS